MKFKLIFLYAGLLVASFGAHISRAQSMQDKVEEKKLVVVVASYNNSQWYKQNLDSLFMQKYPKDRVRIMYIDDCSPDKTGEQVHKYVREKGQEHWVQLFINKERRGALANLYYAINSCDDDEIVLIVDGDDWLENDQVFARVSQAYQDPNVWMTYGQLKSNVSDYGDGYCQPMPEFVIASNGYREYKWITSHLRTFYAGLFKKVKREDLMLDGNFFHVTYDLAIMLPMLEMAAGRLKFIPDVLYMYNELNPLNDFRVRVMEQLKCDKLIRARPKYQALNMLFDSEK